MLRPHVNAHDVSQFPGFGIILHSVACLLFTNLPPHLWHCKIPIAPGSFGVIFAHGLVTQTRALLTFPTIKSAIAAPYYVIPVSEIIPPAQGPIALFWEIGNSWREFSPAPYLELPYPHSESHRWTTWSIGLKWHATSNYPIALDWKLWFLTQSSQSFPRWKVILSCNSTLD